LNINATYHISQHVDVLKHIKQEIRSVERGYLWYSNGTDNK